MGQSLYVMSHVITFQTVNQGHLWKMQPSSHSPAIWCRCYGITAALLWHYHDDQIRVMSGGQATPHHQRLGPHWHISLPSQPPPPPRSAVGRGGKDVITHPPFFQTATLYIPVFLFNFFKTYIYITYNIYTFFCFWKS